MATRKRQTADLEFVPVAERIEDSLWALPDGRRFVASYASDFSLVLEVLDLDHIARYPSAKMIDTFWNDPRSPQEREATRLHPEHTEIHEFGGLWSSREDLKLKPLPSGYWWLFEQPFNGDWLDLLSKPIWAQIRGGETTAIMYDRVKNQLKGLEFAPALANPDPLPDYCPRHGEPHSRQEVAVGEPCPLCGEIPTQYQMERWLVPRASVTPPRMNLMLDWRG